MLATLLSCTLVKRLDNIFHQVVTHNVALVELDHTDTLDIAQGLPFSWARLRIDSLRGEVISSGTTLIISILIIVGLVSENYIFIAIHI